MALGACTGTSGNQVEVRAEEAPAPSTTPTVPPDCAEMLPPVAQAGQLLMVMVGSPPQAEELLTEGIVGGFGLRGRQSRDLGDEVSEAVADAPVTPFVAGVEEGGTVQGLDLAIDSLPSASDLAEGTPSETASLLADHAASMAELGINMNFGPVVDVGSGGGLGTRSFGDDPSTVSSFTDVIIKVQQDAGIASVVKHWPGIGGATTDPDDAPAEVDPVDELRTDDMVPFERAIAAGASGIMVGHGVVPGLTDDDEPASLSRAAITDELRGRLGFDGLIVTDSLGAASIAGTASQDEAAEQAILAGADIALLSGTDAVPDAHDRLTEAITEERIPTEQVVASVRRVLSAKGLEGDCVDVVAAYSSRLHSDDGVPATDTAGTDTTGTDTTGTDG